MSYAEFCAGIAARDGHGCFIRRVLEARRDVQLRSTRRDRAVLPDGLLACDGQIDGHHVVAKQHIKREHGRAEFPLSVFLPGMREVTVWQSLDAMLADSRNGIAACRRHHELVERALVRLFRDELPAHVFEFAREVAMVPRLERDYPLREVAA